MATRKKQMKKLTKNRARPKQNNDKAIILQITILSRRLEMVVGRGGHRTVAANVFRPLSITETRTAIVCA